MVCSVLSLIGCHRIDPAAPSFARAMVGGMTQFVIAGHVGVEIGGCGLLIRGHPMSCRLWREANTIVACFFLIGIRDGRCGLVKF